MSELYILPEISQPYSQCASCLCAMCFHWFDRCSSCFYCLHLGADKCVVKFCRGFCPNNLNWQLREWFEQDFVIKNPNDDVANLPLK